MPSTTPKAPGFANAARPPAGSPEAKRRNALSVTSRRCNTLRIAQAMARNTADDCEAGSPEHRFALAKVTIAEAEYAAACEVRDALRQAPAHALDPHTPDAWN